MTDRDKSGCDWLVHVNFLFNLGSSRSVVSVSVAAIILFVFDMCAVAPLP
jgi:hypothetical protein